MRNALWLYCVLPAAVFCLVSAATDAPRSNARKNLALGTVVTRVMTDIPIVRGTKRNGADRVRFRGRRYNMIAIHRIGSKPGLADYKAGEDFGPPSVAIYWSPRGREPQAGSTYYVTFEYMLSERNHNASAHGAFATDGSLTKGLWRSESPTWIYLDLKKEQTVGEVRLFLLPKYEAKTLGLQWAPDGVVNLKTDKPWQDVLPAKDRWRNPLTEAHIQAVMTLHIQPVKMRYFRLVAPDGGKKDGFVRILEIELYAPPDKAVGRQHRQAPKP